MKRFKSAITGEFVTEDFAKENPKTTVEMTMDNSQAVVEKLQADKEELLHFLKYFKQCVEDEDFIMVSNTDEDIADNVLSKMNSLIQKHKQ